PRETADAGWARAAALSPSLDRGAHDRMADPLPQTGGPLRTPSHHVPGLFPCRLRYDYAEEVMKPVLITGGGIAQRGPANRRPRVTRLLFHMRLCLLPRVRS